MPINMNFIIIIMLIIVIISIGCTSFTFTSVGGRKLRPGSYRLEGPGGTGLGP